MTTGTRPQSQRETEYLRTLRRTFSTMLDESDRRGAQRLLRETLAAGGDRRALLEAVINPSIEAVAENWAEHHELSLSQIYVVGLIVKDSVETLFTGPESAEEPVGKVVIGVADGDHHGLGKLIVVAFLRSAGFQVIDLGLSVSAQTFVDAALSEGADIIAASALMTEPTSRLSEVREEMKRRRAEHIKFLVGGALFRHDSERYKMVGADAMAPTAYEAIGIATRLVEAKRRGRHPNGTS